MNTTGVVGLVCLFLSELYPYNIYIISIPRMYVILTSNTRVLASNVHTMYTRITHMYMICTPYVHHMYLTYVQMPVHYRYE